MDDTWDNSKRIEAINLAVSYLPHDQMPVGVGFKLVHNPASCRRCRATIATLELDSLIKFLENDREEEGVTVDV